MFDIFYLDKQPNNTPTARNVKSADHARELARTRYFWIVDYLCDYTEWNFLWEPAPWEKDFRHAFASQHQNDCGTYLIPKQGYTETKYNNICISRLPCLDHWRNTDFEFDFSWHPDPNDPPYIYHFATQHQRSGGPVYTVPGATEIKFVSSSHVIKNSVDQHWNDTSFAEFDYTWHPDITEHPYIYQFGTQWQKTGGPRYVVPGATEVKYVDAPRITTTAIDRDRWNDLSFSDFDYTWHPDSTNQPYIYQFGTQWQKTGGPRYIMPGATEVKYVSQPRITTTAIDRDRWNDLSFSDFDYTWHPDETEHPYIYQFGTQWQKTGGPRYTMPGATEVKYVNQPRICKTSVDENCWQVPEGDFDNFDYTWHPDSTEEPFIYQFATQHQKTGGPRYVVPGATEVKYIDEIKIKTHKIATGIVAVKHTGKLPVLNTDIPILDSTRFISNYLDTLTRSLSKIQEHEFVWVVSDICDYKNFDFSWHPEIWQNTMLHVFPSNEQKFGDTFFVHIPSFLDQAKKLEVLEWYNPLNFVQEKPVPRFDPPAVKYDSDSVVDAVWNHTFAEPVVQFYRYTSEKPVTISLWQERLRTVVPLRKGSESVIIPRDAKNYLKSQVYDYQWIDKKHKPLDAGPLDIVFISNGESNAEKNYQHLLACAENIPNRIARVDSVKGRAQAYRAAVNASNTDWAFCVFAKLEINKDFDFLWQPDRLQQAKHYIFHAHNPVNGLEYGHMAMIAYNKRLTIETDPRGLDFTLDSAHEVVPLLSGVARYADDPWIAWRSAFRECLKLKHSLPNIENEHRLEQWLTVNLQGDAVGDWSIRGAQDAVEYYDSVQGSFDALRLTYEWSWLEEYFTQRYNQSPDRLCTQFLDQ